MSILLSNFGSFSYFQTFFSLGVEQGLQKLPKFDINNLKLLFHGNILIPWKCLRSKQWGLGLGVGGTALLLKTLLCFTGQARFLHVQWPLFDFISAFLSWAKEGT